ncbi:putative P-loop containing nucleoside triphosphate hydrolase [Helianthus anomalus]
MILELGSGGVLMIGIWGVGGSGKTTLASCLYDDISGKFDGCCFLGDIRAKSSKVGGLVKLQEKILYRVLK